MKEIEPASDAELTTLELFSDMADDGTMQLLARIRQEQARQAELRQENERLRSELRVQTAIAEQNKDDVRKVMSERDEARAWKTAAQQALNDLISRNDEVRQGGREAALDLLCAPAEVAS